MIPSPAYLLRGKSKFGWKKVAILSDVQVQTSMSEKTARKTAAVEQCA
jgi:hypothetical protein